MTSIHILRCPGHYDQYTYLCPFHMFYFQYTCFMSNTPIDVQYISFMSNTHILFPVHILCVVHIVYARYTHFMMSSTHFMSIIHILCPLHMYVQYTRFVSSTRIFVTALLQSDPNAPNCFTVHTLLNFLYLRSQTLLFCMNL